MKHRAVRALVGFLGLLVGLLCTDFYERNRAVGAPADWTHVAGPVVPEQFGTPHMATSVWRLAAGTVWSSQRPADQIYVRPTLDETAVLSISLAADEGSGLWVSVGPSGTLQVQQGGGAAVCMGKIEPLSGSAPIELERGADGVTIRVSNERMVCPVAAMIGNPQIRVREGFVMLQSVGRDRMTDGVPVSPLWWMSALMSIGLAWMLLADGLVALIGRLRGVGSPD
jgi:hypothetical protein